MCCSGQVGLCSNIRQIAADQEYDVLVSFKNAGVSQFPKGFHGSRKSTSPPFPLASNCVPLSKWYTAFPLVYCFLTSVPLFGLCTAFLLMYCYTDLCIIFSISLTLFSAICLTQFRAEYPTQVQNIQHTVQREQKTEGPQNAAERAFRVLPCQLICQLLFLFGLKTRQNTLLRLCNGC